MSEYFEAADVKKNNQYRDGYRLVMKWILVMALMSVLFTALLSYLSLFRKPPAYYATTTSGEVVPLHALSEPVVTSKYILQWASLATRDVLNIGFANYQQQFEQAKPYFTSKGWEQFQEALTSSKLLQTIEDQHVDMSAVVSGAPVILGQAVVHGRFTWRIKLPVLITFTSASSQTKQSLYVTMDVQRVPVLDAEKGIQISNFTTEYTS